MKISSFIYSLYMCNVVPRYIHVFLVRCFPFNLGLCLTVTFLCDSLIESIHLYIPPGSQLGLPLLTVSAGSSSLHSFLRTSPVTLWC
ncbi:hypothetical protein FKM82_018306 [Ascaphus truei]